MGTAQTRQRRFRWIVHAFWVPFAVVACAGAAGEEGAEPAADRPGANSVEGDARAEDRTARPGIEVLLTDSLDLVRARRVGLITNHTGIDRAGATSIDRLFDHPEVDLVALFSPEHGIRGTADPGEQIASGMDAHTGLPVHSLYGETRKPTAEMLAGIDVLLFDIQDVGARYYTYVSTMALAMEAAGEVGIPIVVLDRANPIGGEAVQGNVLDPDYSTFVGLYPVPMRHGMTPGELARMIVGEFGVEADLSVVPTSGWQRDQSFVEAGLPWVAPSPNMPTPQSALHYPGTCLFEGTPLSVGRGTGEAFQVIGAPWLDSERLIASLEAYDLPGISFEPAEFVPETPGDGKFAGQPVQGVRLHALDESYDPTRTALALLIEARRQSGSEWFWRESHFDRLAGTDAVRLGIEAGDGLAELTREWDADLLAFERLRAPYLLYP